jgi:hypothetical protein
MDDYWVVAEEPGMEGLFVCNPVEFEDDRVRFISGLTLVTNLDGLKERGAIKVWQVDDIYEYTNPRLLWEKS